MAASGSKSMPKMQDKEKIEDPPEDQPKLVAIWRGQPFWSLPLPLWPPLSLPLFLPFLPLLGAASLPFCGATVKKGVS